jgi:Domain of Unknown Function (DUF1080)
MTCRNCGINLPPGAVVCPRCGSPTPYNITDGSGGSPQYDKTVAATPYSNSPSPSTAYGTPPYGSQPPINPYEIPPNPYGGPPQGPNPYGTPIIPSSGNYNAPPPPQQYIPPVPPPQYVPPQYTPPPPKKRGRTGLIIGIIALIVVIILVSIIGVVYSNGQHQLAVQATATAQTNATTTAQAHITATSIAATATAVVTTYPFSNKVLLNDPLSDNSKGMKWDVYTNQTGGSCQFSGQAYHARETQAASYNTCYANLSHFSNFTLQVDMTFIAGDRGGLLFRADSVNNKLYYLRFDQDGTYSLFLYVDNTGTNARSLDHGTANGFNTGLNQKNTVGVVARGNSISLYVNNQLINSITDSTYTTGLIGLTAESNTASTEVVYSNLMVWGL